MRSFILIFGSMLSFCIVNGQLTKGNWLVGGSGSFFTYHQNYENVVPANNTTSEYTEVSISADLGYFIIDKLACGLRPGFSSFKGEVTSTGGLKSNTNKFFAGPFVRYYFLSKDKQFNILTDMSYQFGINNWHPEKGKVNNFSAMAGPVVFFNSSVGMQVLLGYTIQKESIDNPTFVYTQTKKGFQVVIGFQIHLEK